MKLDKKFPLLLICIVTCSLSILPVQAAASGKPVFVKSNKPHPVSNRLIVKFKTSKPEQAMSAQQRHAELSRPLSIEMLQQLQSAAGVQMSALRTTGNGAHVLSLHGKQSVAQAVAAIAKLPDVEYAEEDRIETIQAVPNDTYYTTGLTGYPGLWAMQPVTAATLPSSGNDGSYGADFETAWNTSIGTGVVVAVLDTGITPHPDIVGSGGTISPATGNLISSGYDFITDCRRRGETSSNGCPAVTPDGDEYVAPEPDATDTGDYITLAECTDVNSLFHDLTCTAQSNSSWHGTHVSGIIAARGNNNLGVIGGAYGAKILPVRVLGKGGGWSSDISDAIMWAAGLQLSDQNGPIALNPHPAKVINLSLGSTDSCSIERQAAIDAAVSAGVVVVVAAGNENDDVANSSSANCHNVISVAATGRNGSRAYYSNFSSPASNTTNPVTVTLAAQGGEQLLLTYDPGILSTVDSGATIPEGSTYAYKQGTSMATPHVSAAVALMLAYNPALTPSRVKQILSTPAALTPFPSFVAGWEEWDCSLNHNCGAGILNARLALQNSTTLAPGSGGGGGGGCAIQPYGMSPDLSLLLALLAVAVYRFRRRLFREPTAH
ncbi:MAG: S8 family serine peptidase [Gammaproteobacteria bacterium]|nr:S8 family serine peptidase [Gammaproteobacteria bacterium]MBU1776078.1 S8 family serine peptidase [Gammaproteobacteria bacterium]MBU1970106.1 S8 family serine peptidase [Gammaproteobacteria bacterium]